jgi:hypothetical protein
MNPNLHMLGQRASHPETQRPSRRFFRDSALRREEFLGMDV